MHPDTLAALRLLAVTLILHPEDAAALSIYGDLPDHLGDVIDDYIDEDDANGRSSVRKHAPKNDLASQHHLHLRQEP
jgi:hypothetical protein